MAAFNLQRKRVVKEALNCLLMSAVFVTIYMWADGGKTRLPVDRDGSYSPLPSYRDDADSAARALGASLQAASSMQFKSMFSHKGDEAKRLEVEEEEKRGVELPDWETLEDDAASNEWLMGMECKGGTTSTNGTSAPPPDITLVSAYFDLGPITKGATRRYPSDYIAWSKAWSRVASPLVVYVDTKRAYDLIGDIRDAFRDITRVVLVERQSSWAFPGLLERVAKVISKEGYPRHSPNTDHALYATITHAKMVLLARAIKSDYFRSNYFAWVDFGYWRLLPGNGSDFTVHRPVNMSEEAVVFSEVTKPVFNQSPWKIITGNSNWLAAGFMLARRDVMTEFVNFYMNFTDKMIQHDLIGAEQQVLYSMFTDAIRPHHHLVFQTYAAPRPASRGMSWFYLGYHSTRGLYQKPCPPHVVRTYRGREGLTRT